MRSKPWQIRWSELISPKKVATLTLGTTTFLVTTSIVSPAQAQVPSLQDLNPLSPDLLKQNTSDRVESDCVTLEERCLFEVADRKSDLPNRIQGIEQRLEDTQRIYLTNKEAKLDLYQKQQQKLPNIYVSVGGKTIRLLSVTSQDADLKGVELQTRADQIIDQVKQGLQQAKQERQPKVLARKGGIALGTGVIMLIASLAIYRWERRSKQSKEKLAPSEVSPTQPITTQLDKKQQWHLTEVKQRLFQLTQVGILGGGTLFILGLFPTTRFIQVWVISSLGIPVQLGLIGLGTYVMVRLSYALVDKFASAVARNYLLTPEANRRLQLRLSTISSVSKGIITVTLSGVSILIALSTIGVNIGPILAGAGIIGVGLSLASQSLIKDAINGFFIILEDQYAVGDVITVGDVGGLVETMNLRITQLRDAEGRLITVPNSEIKIVANLSNNWSRADLSIPIAYYADVDKGLELISHIADKMSHDEHWRPQFVDKPEVLGVDDFGSRGVIIRVWIKTQPLKQWDVAREFRRRLKVALDEAGISIPMPQQEVWFNNSLPTKSTQDGKSLPGVK